MVPRDSRKRKLGKRGPFQVGRMKSDILDYEEIEDLCGIYEWRATQPDQPNTVVYVGSTCTRNAQFDLLSNRIFRYCKYGNHKRDLINDALSRGYELWVRVKYADNEKNAKQMENALLESYDYAWNKRQNGGDNGIRHILV